VGRVVDLPQQEAMELQGHMQHLFAQLLPGCKSSWFSFYTSFHTILCYVIEHVFINTRGGREIPAPLRKVRGEIDRRFQEELSLDALAQLAGWSAPYLCSQFKDAYQETPRQYQLRLQLQMAQNLLVDSSMTIGEIAYMVGFASHEHFARLFKKQFGYSPSEFRSQNA
jgi:AraC-like DNA-binding protein